MHTGFLRSYIDQEAEKDVAMPMRPHGRWKGGSSFYILFMLLGCHFFHGVVLEEGNIFFTTVPLIQDD